MLYFFKHSSTDVDFHEILHTLIASDVAKSIPLMGLQRDVISIN